MLSKLKAIPDSPNLLIIDNADEMLTAVKDLSRTARLACADHFAGID